MLNKLFYNLAHYADPHHAFLLSGMSGTTPTLVHKEQPHVTHYSVCHVRQLQNLPQHVPPDGHVGYVQISSSP